MSGSGGFYRYRCKFFYSHNCLNWVWVNNAACADCLSKGRDDEESSPPKKSALATREICVPHSANGTLSYTIVEMVPTGESRSCGSPRGRGKNAPMTPNSIRKCGGD